MVDENYFAFQRFDFGFSRIMIPTSVFGFLAAVWVYYSFLGVSARVITVLACCKLCLLSLEGGPIGFC